MGLRGEELLEAVSSQCGSFVCTELEPTCVWFLGTSWVAVFTALLGLLLGLCLEGRRMWLVASALVSVVSFTLTQSLLPAWLLSSHLQNLTEIQLFLFSHQNSHVLMAYPFVSVQSFS